MKLLLCPEKWEEVTGRNGHICQNCTRKQLIRRHKKTSPPQGQGRFSFQNQEFLMATRSQHGCRNGDGRDACAILSGVPRHSRSGDRSDDDGDDGDTSAGETVVGAAADNNNSHHRSLGMDTSRHSVHHPGPSADSRIHRLNPYDSLPLRFHKGKHLPLHLHNTRHTRVPQHVNRYAADSRAVASTILVRDERLHERRFRYGWSLSAPGCASPFLARELVQGPVWSGVPYSAALRKGSQPPRRTLTVLG